MGYKYETHLHTSNSSKCGHTSAADYVSYYRELGYDGIFITDHFYLGNTCIDRDLPWDEWVRQYCGAYREAKREGDRQGLKVFFGWESTFGHGEDFLIYGLDEEWLLRNPDVRFWNQKEQYEHVHADGGFVVQAHPFRERHYQDDIKLHPCHSDAWETANAANKPYMNVLAYDYAGTHGIPMTAGSDIHRKGVTGYGVLFGVETEKPLESGADYGALLLSGTGYRLMTGEGWYLAEKKNPWFEVYEYNKENERIRLSGDFYEGAEQAEDPHIR